MSGIERARTSALRSQEGYPHSARVGYPISSARSAQDPRSSKSIHAKERRYATARWQRLRARVLTRDLGRCRIVAGCLTPATVADHIIPASLGMTDAQFFADANLRAACRKHNLARGFAASVTGAQSGPSAVITKDYS